MKEKIKKKINGAFGDRIKNGLLACFSAIAPVWNFLFLKTKDPDLANNGISYSV